MRASSYIGFGTVVPPLSIQTPGIIPRLESTPPGGAGFPTPVEVMPTVPPPTPVAPSPQPSGPTSRITLGTYGTMALFALATLPTELNASSRAMSLLTSSGLIVGRDEEKGAKAVLNAAALTYVAFVAQVLLQA